FGAHSLTHAELEQRANHLAARLRVRGVESNDRIGICLERSVHAMVAVLAVLKAGGAYLPLDPRYPSERLSFMLADGALRLLITQSALKDLVPYPPEQTICLDVETSLAQPTTDREQQTTDTGSLAYVIYTSGSTGKTKG